MFDSYSSVPLIFIYIGCFIVLGALIWSFARDAAVADEKTKRKLIKIYAWGLLGSIALFCGIYFSGLTERLFPSFYEHEEMRQKINNPDWNNDFDIEDWGKPFK